MKRLVAIFPVLAACQTYAQHRAALVPHQGPLLTDGQPLSAPAELALGASTVHDLGTPKAGDPNAGDQVPDTQLAGRFAFRVTPNLSLGAIYERGLSATAHAVTTSQPPIDGGDVNGYGWSFVYSIETGDPHWRIALGTELVFWDVPWVQYTTCISANCPVEGYTVTSKGSDTVPTIALGITPSYRSGPFTVFGGIGIRNQPTIAEKVTTNVPDSDADVQSGPQNVTIHAGAAAELGAGVRAMLVVHHTLSTDPVRYAPGLGLMVAIPLGDRSPDRSHI